MAERPGGVVAWFKKLVGNEKSSDTDLPTTLVPGASAVLGCEMLVADAVCRTARSFTLGAEAESVRNAFGTVVAVREFGDAQAALAAASGLALSGQRTAVFLSSDRLAAASAQLRSAVERHLPLVLQVTVGPAGRAELDVAAESGAFVLDARDVQEAIDLTWAAHLTAESSLTPGVVVLDGNSAAWSIARVDRPDSDLVRSLVGSPDASMVTPTPAQCVLFGDRRRRVPRWFDLDHPLATGSEPTELDRGAAACSRRLLFADHVDSLLTESTMRVAEATGRSLPAICGHRLDRARHVVVCQGSVVHVLRAVADRVGGRAGVLGLTRISPFPAEEVREALCRAESVTVLEQRAPEAESTLLLDRVRAAMRGHAACILSATYLRPDASEIAELFANMGAGTAAKSRVALGVAAPGDARRFPRRQALAQRTRRDYPELERATLRPSDAIDLRPPDAKTVLLRLPSIAPPEGPIEALGQLLREVVGAHVAGYSEQKQPGVWEIWLTASSDAMPVACTGLRADVALISNPDSVAAARALADGCCCVVVSRSNGGDLWRTLPPRFRSAIRDRGLRLFRAADVETLIRGGAALASGRSDELDEVPWNELAVDPVERDEVDLPLAVKRLGADSPGPENVARFWGEFAQPRLGDPGFATEIDPHLALGAVPACTASFNEASSARTRIPVIDPDACTGCGNCWVSCPDSAIGAVAIGPQALLDAAADRFGAIDPEPAAGRLRRAHRQLAARWASELSQASPGALPATRLDDAYAGLIDTMKVTEEDRPGFDRAFAPVREWIDALPFGTTDALFHDAERDQKGSGELLLLAVDSRACQACGICAAVCPDDAIRLDSDVAAGMTVQRAAWEAWECLPDTSGKLIARAADDSRVGRLAAVLLSRHCLFSLAGGEGAEPGSGERIAVRQATAVVEYRMQRRRLSQVERLKELAGALRERIGLSLSQAVSVDDLRTLDDALDAAAAARTPIGQVVARMEELGERTDLDVPVVRGLVRTAQELEAATEQILCGLSGAGRARYGIVVSGVERGSWMTTFPRNPFGVPVAVDRDGTGADLALGLAHGFLAECVRDARLVRTAELLLEAPDDLPARKRELAALSWGDLTPDERNVCPPILLVAEAGFGGIAKLLSSELPIKLLLLDPANLESRTVDPLVPELAGARSYVASTSIAHPEHLFDSVMDALDFGGPALIRVHTPSPTRHGFSTESTVERARLAVDCRVRPLLRFAPPESGGIGRGLNLDLNPDVNEPWSHDDAGTELTPTTWAAGETRYANDPDQAHAVRERARSWTTLQELAGVAAPFAAKVEARVEADLRATHQAELASVRADYEGRLEEADKNQARAQAARLRDRLMQLAGYGPPERGAPDRSKG